MVKNDLATMFLKGGEGDLHVRMQHDGMVQFCLNHTNIVTLTHIVRKVTFDPIKGVIHPDLNSTSSSA